MAKQKILNTNKSSSKDSRISYTDKEIHRVVSFEEPEPYDLLGPHAVPNENAVAINAYLPQAHSAWVVLKDGPSDPLPMQSLHSSGLFQAVLENTSTIPAYRIQVEDESGTSSFEDPYAFSTEISDFDLYLIGEGNHYKSYEKFGAHVMEFRGVKGVHFAVWAPNAKSVSIIGNFNGWTRGAHPMTRIRYSGVWGLFIPGLDEGEIYKFAVKTPENEVLEKSDPYAFRSEVRPRTASIVSALDHYQWQDDIWMKDRAQKNFLHEPLSVYEVHLGSWMRDEKSQWGFVSYRDLAQKLVDYVKSMGYTHIELMPLAEHPLDQSWGYQVINYFAPTSRFGTPEDFMYFVDQCHKNGIGVIVDWVPAHFPKDAHGLNNFDGRQIYAYQGWKKAEHKDWGTLVFDYGRNEVRNFLISNALFWFEKYHIDGLRVDAVASMLYLDYSRKPGEWEPNIHGGNENLEAIDFLKRFNEVVHGQYPGVLTIAEESTAWGGVSRPTYVGGLGFSLKWNMGWMHDTLDYFSKDPIHRRWSQGQLTFSLLYAFTENFALPISHDEVVFGKRSLLEKMPGDDWQKFANLRLFLSYMFAHPGKKLLFMGCDIAQRPEWNFDASLEWHLLESPWHGAIRKLVQDLNALYRKHPALHDLDFDPRGFEWIDFADAESSALSFIRWSKDRGEAIVAVFNMTPVPRPGYRIGVPFEGFYREILNSDSRDYEGSGVGNLGGLGADPQSFHGRPFSLSVNLPPLGAVYFRHESTP